MFLQMYSISDRFKRNKSRFCDRDLLIGGFLGISRIHSSEYFTLKTED